MDPETAQAADPASVVVTLRKLIIDGRHPAGSRLAEVAVANALGVSRTPVRLAFRTLEQEGLLQKAGARGFVVREFSESDVLCAVEVRGTLEGLAARRLAERGLSEAQRSALESALSDGEAVLADGVLTEERIGVWGEVNERFHRAIVEGTDSRVIADAIARNNHLPFASAGSIAIDKTALDREYLKLRMAQMQHVLVFDALVAREGARVEMLMREHAWIGFRYGRLFGLAAPVLLAAATPRG
jgi:GntR family transcriptional regulator, vanillate catabolism transcriptional regulator